MDESALRTLLNNLDASRSSWHGLLHVFTFLIIVGLGFDLFVIIKEFWDDLKEFRYRQIHPYEIHLPKRPSAVVLILGLIGTALIVIGVWGELYVDVQAGKMETQIREANDALLSLVIQEAGTAKSSAETAEGAAKGAKLAANEAAGVANTAKSLADDAKARVADATKKLVVVETQTATLSQQADSLRREIADEKAALESERAKRIRLQRAVSQRSIGGYGSDVLALLKSFVPIDFSVSCTPGRETQFLAGQLGAMPQNAGWKWLGFKPFINGNGCAMEKLPEGVTVTSYLGPNGETDSSKDAAEALAHWLRQNGIVAVAYPSGSLPRTVGILIGPMPID